MTESNCAPGCRAGIIRSVVLLISGLLAVGCVTQTRPTDSLVQSPAYDLPPKQMAEAMQKIVAAPPISLPIQEVEPGVFLTGWQEPFRGEFHIVRYWHERTRYRITITPDFNDPAHRSHIQIADQTEQRPDESGPNEKAKQWTPAPDIHRPDRSSALLQQIENGLSTYPRH
ncbi:MAG TPA: hypothetical protein VGI81_17640 [Tepidisphaeraceae bacterium]